MPFTILPPKIMSLEIKSTEYQHGLRALSSSGGYTILISIGKIEDPNGEVLSTHLTRKKAKKLRDWLIEELKLDKG